MIPYTVDTYDHFEGGVKVGKRYVVRCPDHNTGFGSNTLSGACLGAMAKVLGFPHVEVENLVLWYERDRSPIR